MRRIIVLSALMALALVSGLLAPMSAAAPATPFDVTGFVEDVSATIDPTPIAGENRAFVLRPLTRVSDSAQSHVNDGALKIYGTPATNYFAQDDTSGLYLRTNYAGAVKEGAEIRVAGRFVTTSAGVRFLANYVWRPPYQGGDNTGAVPQCGMVNSFASAKPFQFIASVQQPRLRLPCTGIGGLPGGFALEDFQLVSTAVAPAVVAYGGLVDVYITPATVYIHEGKRSDFATVVRPRQDVQVWGNYVSVRGAWLLVAKVVMSPPTGVAPKTTESVEADVDAVRTSGNNYSGVSRGPSFVAGTFESNLDWTRTATGWNVTGTWRLFNGSGDRIVGTLSGTLTGTELNVGLTATDGFGYFRDMTGSGSLIGGALAGATPPKSLDGRLSLTLERPAEPEALGQDSDESSLATEPDETDATVEDDDGLDEEAEEDDDLDEAHAVEEDDDLDEEETEQDEQS